MLKKKKKKLCLFVWSKNRSHSVWENTNFQNVQFLAKIVVQVTNFLIPT